ncbi:hypothetical protein AB0M36_36945 [Actinoplanes sp. NPDC051346]|uniref:hypothetical protein n=1 Tax=Actinoplanes sp. NPDC051346 TaxID=3155048 RepID=UPI00343EB89A
MPSYTITIAPNDDSGTTTTLIVDTSGTEVRITDVHLHADAGLVGGHMPTVDVGLLLQAVNPAAVAPTPSETAPADRRAAAIATPAPARALEAAPTPAESSSPATTPATPGRRRRAEKPVAAPAKKARARRTASPATTAGAAGETVAPAKAITAGRRKAAPAAAAKKAAAGTASGSKGRVYRRTPDDLAKVFKKAGSASAVADHYGVPRYTAQGWIQRLRKNEAASVRTAR